MSRTFQLLLVLALVGIVRVGGSRAHKNVTHGPHSCGGVDVPYPFGIVEDGGGGDFRTGFHVMCDAGEPVLHTTGGDGKPIKIGNFSIRMAEVRVWLPVAWQCYDSSGNVSGSDYNPLEFNDEGVYRISHARNNLFVLGCETTGYLGSQPDQGSGESRSYAQFTGCLSYCNNSQSAASGACSGVGCCHVEIPPDLLGNWVAFVIYDHRNKVNFSPCDYAFVAEKKHYSFNTTDLKRALRGTTWEMPVVLDWAIRDSPTCKLARKKKEGYACKSSNSRCLDSTNGPGYICNCRRGYEGNPYNERGCTDINECEHLDHYPCKGDCENKEGSYECTCPKHTNSANPFKERCSQNLPLGAKIIVGSIGGLFIIAIMVFLWLLHKEKRRMRDNFEKNGGPILEKINNIKLFNKEDIRKILKNKKLLGNGHFGTVSMGHTEDKQVVAVKEPINRKSPNDQFVNEIIIQSRVIHKNIVKLIGCCLQFKVPTLIYEFVPNGSLDDILHGKNHMPLKLGLRLQIAAESAEGLAYMHSKTTTTILHGDVKPANILLNEKFMPKISDFGISRLMVTGMQMQHTGCIIFDKAYVDPVYRKTQQLTTKSDIYSFGVVLLELITRKKASHSDNNLLGNFLDTYTKDKSVTELLDKELGEDDQEIFGHLIGMIMQCINLDVNQRPEMTDVAERLHDMVKRLNNK
ncbi:hypothetical protein CFC21_064263 [Triticum aestivum]|uniref:Protein kinase domain-containing protein n=2 Tax=Triticum aestivum TaxID=4565 RepID=A0A9R1H117_WHEAT|nr:wall-associated receptor kinase 2-like [Triticum aestivum]KAF7056893.1 hypothetical protein CFC21_064263 [Triticum aestivum]